jgi:enoyl-CoA hydratase/carnithine racemase
MTTPTTIELALDGAIATISLNRPAKLNAMDSHCLREVTAALAIVGDNDSVRVVVIRGNGGRAFTAGADLTEIAEFRPKQMLGYNRLWMGMFEAIERLPKPVIASVEGWATGGGTELSLCCDFVICADTARFGLTEINVGVIPGAGAAVRLTRWLGRLRAKELLMLGNTIDGQQAVAWHLANECVPAAQLTKRTAEIATTLTKKPLLALAAAKNSINIGAEASMAVALEYELREFLLLFSTKDQKEGMAAFLEKREPQFTGE